jgi:hypothetical protein
MFACPHDVAETIDLNRKDAPRTVSHSLGAKRERPAVTESARPDNFGHEIWDRIFSRLPVPGQLTYIRSNSYGSASRYVLDDALTDYLAGWTPETADVWAPLMEEVADQLVNEFADDTTWRPLRGGAAGTLLRLRGHALQARLGPAAGVFYYWYAPLSRV